ncbi:MAG TPA: halocarboxylic acid dehydrogenase DehI family protein [Chthonomonadaceae bacterium]|nr:halocarboxylic acid dehydrogenase DehI family protein [Chthonomonadaceae bacterium]
MIAHQPIAQNQTPPEAQALLEDIQNTLGIPWQPANWRTYARYPDLLRLFWERVKPATATEPFLEDALAITERAYQDAMQWYWPSYQVDTTEAERERIAWEIDAFEFGNPQLLILQVALSRALQGQTVGQPGSNPPRRAPSPYRQPQIEMVDAEHAPPDVRQLYESIKQTLGLPLVNSDYQALAKWPEFLRGAWEDIKPWRDREEYQRLIAELTQMAEERADRLRPEIGFDEGEIRAALAGQADLEEIRQQVDTFTRLLPGLIVNDALFRISAGGGQQITPPLAASLLI